MLGGTFDVGDIEQVCDSSLLEQLEDVDGECTVDWFGEVMNDGIGVLSTESRIWTSLLIAWEISDRKWFAGTDEDFFLSSRWPLR